MAIRPSGSLVGPAYNKKIPFLGIFLLYVIGRRLLSRLPRRSCFSNAVRVGPRLRPAKRASSGRPQKKPSQQLGELCHFSASCHISPTYSKATVTAPFTLAHRMIRSSDVNDITRAGLDPPRAKDPAELYGSGNSRRRPKLSGSSDRSRK